MKESISKLKKVAWKLCSEYNRRKDANADGYTSCVTCGKVAHYKSLQAGHFVPSRCNSILFDDRGIHAQCLTNDSSLKLSTGKYRNISEIKIGDELMSFNEKTFVQEYSLVECTNSFLPDELYEVELEDGKKFFATKDHRVVANGQWVRIKELLHSISTSDILEL